jgi:hypothetical protein
MAGWAHAREGRALRCSVDIAGALRSVDILLEQCSWHRRDEFGMHVGAGRGCWVGWRVPVRVSVLGQKEQVTSSSSELPPLDALFSFAVAAVSPLPSL